VNEGQPRSREHLVNESVPRLSFWPLVRSIVEFDPEYRVTIALPNQKEVHVLGGDSVQGALALTPIKALLDLKDVGQADFGCDDGFLVCDRREDPEERSLCGGKQRIGEVINIGSALALFNGSGCLLQERSCDEGDYENEGYSYEQ
jgi:hypothetical protein